MSYFPLIIFHTISFYNSKIVRVISMKLGTLIKHDEMMCHTISCPPYNLKTVREISVKLGTHDETMCHAQEL